MFISNTHIYFIHLLYHLLYWDNTRHSDIQHTCCFLNVIRLRDLSCYVKTFSLRRNEQQYKSFKCNSVIISFDGCHGQSLPEVKSEMYGSPSLASRYLKPIPLLHLAEPPTLFELFVFSPSSN